MEQTMQKDPEGNRNKPSRMEPSAPPPHLPDARKLLQAFTEEKLHGDLRNLKEFDFELLREDRIFGCRNPEDFDADDTFIIRAIFILLFRNVFPEMTDMGSVGRSRSYRGDTIHSFHTIFGRPIPGREGHFNGIEHFAPIEEELYERIRRFHKKGRTLGNFVVLPNIPLQTGKEFLTLNTYRGTSCCYRDYFDRFLLALEPCLTKESRKDRILYKLVHCQNKRAFAPYREKDGFVHLAQALLLDDFLNEEGSAANLFADAAGNVCFHWENPRPPREKYLQGVINYLDRAEKTISARSNRMILLLQEFC